MPRLCAFLGLLSFALTITGCTAPDLDDDTFDREPVSEERPPVTADPGRPSAGDAAVGHPGETVAESGRAVATLEGKSGAMVTGEGIFVRQDDGIAFGVYVENAEPGRHAVHIHETGDCSAPDASSAGDHWNPTGESHGRWGDDPFHLGDIGNLEVTEDGKGNLELTAEPWTLTDGDHAVVGKALVVHRGADDFTTQPDGEAGDRVACGVIELTTPIPPSS